MNQYYAKKNGSILKKNVGHTEIRPFRVETEVLFSATDQGMQSSGEFSKTRESRMKREERKGKRERESKGKVRSEV